MFATFGYQAAGLGLGFSVLEEFARSWKMPLLKRTHPYTLTSYDMYTLVRASFASVARTLAQ